MDNHSRAAVNQMRATRKVIRSSTVSITVDGEDCVKIPLTKGMWALVSKADAETVSRYNWHAVAGGRKHNNLWYAAKWLGSKPNRVLVKLHRFLLGLTDPKIEADHKNGDGLDNRRSNLRVASHEQQTRNRCTNHNSKSGFKGVTRSSNGKWRARIGHVQIGTFETKEEAAQAYLASAGRIHGEFSVHQRQQPTTETRCTLAN